MCRWIISRHRGSTGFSSTASADKELELSRMGNRMTHRLRSSSLSTLAVRFHQWQELPARHHTCQERSVTVHHTCQERSVTVHQTVIIHQLAKIQPQLSTNSTHRVLFFVFSTVKLQRYLWQFDYNMTATNKQTFLLIYTVSNEYNWLQTWQIFSQTSSQPFFSWKLRA